MRYLLKNRDKIFFILLLVLLFLIKLPAIYLLPFKGILFISHTIAKGLLVLLLFTVFVTDGKKLSIFIGKNKPLFTILLFYFVGQSLSVLGAKDVFLFWKGFHNVISGLTIFLLAYYFIFKSSLNLKKTADFILIAGLTLLLIELVFFFFAPQLISFITKIAQPEVADAYLTNLARGRNSLDMNIELFLPFLLYWFVKERDIFKHRLAFLISAGVIFLAFASNFRTRVLDVIFAFVASLYLILKTKNVDWSKTMNKWLFVVILLPIILSTAISNRMFNYNIFNRLTFEDKSYDVDTITFRYYSALKSIDLFLSSPIVGVGLGNYIVSAPRNTAGFEFYYLNNKNLVTYSDLASYSPHNVLFSVLAESGLVGIISYLMLMVYFIYRDLPRFLNTKSLDIISASVIAFWMLFLFMLFNPSHSIFVIGWFWFLRGLIEANYGKEG